jgi:hypothetical protein
MTRSLTSFAEFDKQLANARAELAQMHAAEPDDGAIASVARQLDALHAWTRGGRCPAQAEKDQLNFGLIASRELADYAVAPLLYALASFVIYWDDGTRGPGESQQ